MDTRGVAELTSLETEILRESTGDRTAISGKPWATGDAVDGALGSERVGMGTDPDRLLLAQEIN
jgi:hypothetical protein